MKKTLTTILLLTIATITFAQNGNFFADSTVYFKEKTNLKGKNSFELGVSKPIYTYQKFKLSANIGYQGGFDAPFKSNSFTSGGTLSYNISKIYSVYTKTGTNFSGTWSQETGAKIALTNKKNMNVALNFGYVFQHPFNNNALPGWTLGLSASFPIVKN